MTLSIIVPVYRVEATLDRCINSIVQQSFTDYELILVDDGSPDSCPRLCDDWALRDSRIKVIHKQNGGLSDARNAGLEQAEGEYVTFVDSDDYVAPETYARVMPLVNDCDIVEFPVYRFYGSARQSMLHLNDQLYTDMRTYWLEAQAYAHCYACNKIYRHDLFKNVHFPTGIVFEDVATLPLLLRETKRIRTTGKGCYFYCLNEAGITSTAQGPQLEMLLKSHLHIIDRWCDDLYYMHVLNIQMDVTELTGHAPTLPYRKVNPLTKSLTFTNRIKALALNIIGIDRLCRLNRLTHSVRSSHS